MKKQLNNIERTYIEIEFLCNTLNPSCYLLLIHSYIFLTHDNHQKMVLCLCLALLTFGKINYSLPFWHSNKPNLCLHSFGIKWPRKRLIYHNNKINQNKFTMNISDISSRLQFCSHFNLYYFSRLYYINTSVA